MRSIDSRWYAPLFAWCLKLCYAEGEGDAKGRPTAKDGPSPRVPGDDVVHVVSISSPSCRPYMSSAAAALKARSTQ